MPRTTVIKDDAALGRNIQTFTTHYSKAHDEAHAIAVNCLYQAAEHGNPSRLNEFYTVLKTNDQEALRNFIRRVSAVIGGWDGVRLHTTEEMQVFIKRGSFLKFGNGKFTVVRDADVDTAKAAKAKMTKLAKVIINPDGKTWHPFLERSVRAEMRQYGMDELLRGFEALLRRASGDVANVNSRVPKKVLRDLTKFGEVHLGLGMSSEATERAN